MAIYEVENNGEWVKVEATSFEDAVRRFEAGNILDPIAKGATLGFSDEIIGGVSAIPATLELMGIPTTMEEVGEFFAQIPESYRGVRDVIRERQEGFRARNPIASPITEIAATMPTAVLGGARLAGAQPSVARMAMVGGAEAGTAGFGSAEGEIMSQMLEAGMAAPIGALFGAGGGLVGRLWDRMTRAQDVPQRVIRAGMEGDLLTPAQMTARQAEMGPAATPVDVGGEGLLAVGQQVAGSSPATRAMAERALISGRQAGQTQRITEAVEDATGMRPDYGLAAGRIDDIAEARSVEAKPLWDLVRQQPIELTENLDNALNQGIVKRAFQKAQQEAALTGRQLPPIYEVNEAGDLVRTGVAPDMDAWAMIKSHIGDVIEGNKEYTDELTGRPTKLGRAVRKFYDGLVKELKDQNDFYEAAMDAWAGKTEVIEAVRKGQNMMSNAVTVDDVRRLAKNMSASEKEGYLAGVMESVKERMGRITAEGQTGEFSFMQTPNFQAKLREFLPEGQAGDDALKQFADRLKTERRFKETGRDISKGAQSQLRAQITEMLEPTARRGGFVENVATGNVGEAAANVVREQVGRIVGEVPVETRERIAELIFKPGGTKELLDYLKQSQIDQARIQRLMSLTAQVPAAFAAGGVTAF